MATHETRDRICEAAIRTASRDGLLAMTLDNVAKEAGISKGGVMYHFPSKDDLVRGMLEYFGARVEQQVLRQMAADPEPRFRWARSMLTCLFPDPQVAADREDPLSPEVMDRFMLAALAAAVNSPGLIEPLRQVGLRLRERLLSDPADGLEQLLIWLAVDGLFLWQFVGLIRQDEPLYAEIGAALRAKVMTAATSSAAHRAPTPGESP
jgi:AcrR family transcriptional regulator